MPRRQRKTNGEGPATATTLALGPGVTDAVEDLTQLAAMVCRCTYAAVAEHSEGSYRIASTAGVELSELGADTKLLQYVSEGSGIKRVNDALEDRLIAADPWVAARPNVRFLAGTPLRASSGQVLGALIVMKEAPANLTGEQQGALEIVARHLGRQFELRKEMLSVQREVSELQAINKELRETKEILSSIVDHMDHGVLVTDLKGRYLIANNKAARLLQRTRAEDIIGQKEQDFLSDKDREAAAEHVRVVIGTKSTHKLQENVVLDGQECIYETVYGPVVDRNGNITGILKIQRDVTPWKQSQDHLEKLVAERTKQHREVADELKASEERFRMIAESVDDLITMLDTSGKRLYANPSFRRLVRADETVIGSEAIQDVHPEDRDRVRDVFRRAVETATGQRTEYRLLLTDAQERHLESKSNVILNPAGKVDKVVVVARDITDRKNAEEQLKRTGAELKTLVEQLEARNQESVELSRMTDLLQASQKEEEAYQVLLSFRSKLFPMADGALNIWDEPRQQLLGVAKWGKLAGHKTPFDKSDCIALRMVKPHRVADPESELSCGHLGQLKSPYLCIPLTARGELLGSLHLQFNTNAHKDLAQANQWSDWLRAQEALAIAVADRTALGISNIRLHEKLKAEALLDPLTGLYNRRYLEHELNLEIQRLTRHSKSLGVILIDLDYFKQLNDQYGHDAGDEALCFVAAILQQSVRAGDIAARLGGEEFLLMLVGATAEVIVQRAEFILRTLRERVVSIGGGTSQKITASIGVAFVPKHGTNATEVIRSADKAMYQAKEAGRDRVKVLD